MLRPLCLPLLLLAVPAAAQCELQKVFGSTAAAGQSVGATLALDGSTLVLGNDGSQGFLGGSETVHVLDATPSGWSESTAIVGPAAPYSGYGGRVFVEGTTMVVVEGGNYFPCSYGCTNVFVYDLIGGVWTLTGTLGVYLPGWGLWIEYANGTISVSEMNWPGYAQPTLVEFYERAAVGSTWARKSWQYLSQQWYVLELADDGALALGSDYWSGPVDVWERSGSTWAITAGITPPQYGPMDSDGGTVVIAAPNDATFGTDAGAVHVYDRVAGTFALTATVYSPAPLASGSFGAAVLLRGGRLVVRECADATCTGVRYHVFDRAGGLWSHTATVAAPAEHGRFGGFDLDGDTLVLGAPHASELGVDTGAAFVHSIAGAGCPSLTVDTYGVSAAGGGTQTLTLDVGAGEAGQGCVLLGSASGISPGVVLGGVLVPLNVDPYSLYVLNNLAGPLYVGGINLLDGAGRATASIQVPPLLGASLYGVRFEHALGVFDPATGGARLASNPVALIVGS